MTAKTFSRIVLGFLGCAFLAFLVAANIQTLREGTNPNNVPFWPAGAAIGFDVCGGLLLIGLGIGWLVSEAFD